MHTFGHPAELEELLKISKDFNIKLIEDAAEAIGSKYYGYHVGTFGHSGILSFNGNKTISTGNGGMLLTNSKKVYLYANGVLLGILIELDIFIHQRKYPLCFYEVANNFYIRM